MGSRSQPVRAPPGSAAAPGLACIPGRGASWLHPLHKEVAGGQAGTRPSALCPARRAPDVADPG